MAACLDHHLLTKLIIRQDVSESVRPTTSGKQFVGRKKNTLHFTSKVSWKEGKADFKCTFGLIGNEYFRNPTNQTKTF